MSGMYARRTLVATLLVFAAGQAVSFGQEEPAPSTPPLSLASAELRSGAGSIDVDYKLVGQPEDVASVALLAKGPGEENFAEVGRDDAPSSTGGTIAFTPEHGDGRYELTTVATDTHGNSEPQSGAPKALTLVDSAAPSARVEHVESSPAGPVTIAYSSNDEGETASGVESVQLWVKAPGATDFTKAPGGPGPPVGAFTYTPPEGTDGKYQFAVQAKDKVGNEEPDPAATEGEANVDRTPPRSSARTPTAEGRLAEIPYAATDGQDGSGVSHVELWAIPPGAEAATLAGVSPGDAGSFQYPLSADGTYTFFTRARDHRGNYEAEPTEAERRPTLDFSGTPRASRASAPGRHAGGQFAVSYDVLPDASGLQEIELWARAPGDQHFVKAGSDPTPASHDTISYQPPGPEQRDGVYEFHTVAIDSAGNAEQKPPVAESVTLVDGTPPKSSVVAAPDPPSGQPIRVAYSSDDGQDASASGVVAVKLFVRRRGDSQWQPGPESPAPAGVLEYEPPADGTYELATVARDQLGNVEPIKENEEERPVVDTTGPASTLKGTKRDGRVLALDYTSDQDDPSGVRLVELWARVPGAPAPALVAQASTLSSGQFRYPLTLEGTYEFFTRAIDGRGNEGAASNTVAYDFDATAPASRASSPAHANSKQIAVSYVLEGEATDVKRVDLLVRRPGDVKFELSGLTDEAPQGNGQFSFQADGDGRYEFKTRAEDDDGNVETEPEIADTATNLDTRPPVATATSAPVSPQSAPIVVAYSASDPPVLSDPFAQPSGVESVRLWVQRPGSSSFEPVASSGTTVGAFQFTPDAGPGTYLFAATAKDVAGNEEGPPAAAETSTKFDLVPQSSVTAAPSTSTTPAITVGYTREGGSGAGTIELWAKGPGEPDFRLASVRPQEQGTPQESGTFTYAANAEGEYALYTRARDASGGYEAAPPVPDAVTTFDAEKPASSATGPLTPVSSHHVTVTYHAADPASAGLAQPGSGTATVELWKRSPGDTEFSLATEPDRDPATPVFDLELPADGRYELYTIARDRAGNAEDRPEGVDPGFNPDPLRHPGAPLNPSVGVIPDLTLIVDTVAPVTADDVPEEPRAEPVTVTLTAADETSGVAETWYTTDGSDPRTSPTRAEYSADAKPLLEDGEAIRYYSVDLATNAEPVKTSRPAWVDADPPATTSNVPRDWRAAPVIVTLTPDDGPRGSGVEATWYTKDGSDPTTSKTRARYTDKAKPRLGHGQAIRFYSVDELGHEEAVRTSEPAKVDQLAPTTHDDVPARPSRVPVAVTLSASDGASGVADTWYTTDGSDPSDRSNPRRRRYDAAHKPVLHHRERITYSSVDAAGNVESARSSRSAQVRRDRKRPSVTARGQRTADLAEVVTRGLLVTVGCSETCRVQGELLLASRDARRLGLRMSRPLLLGRSSKLLPGGTRARLRLSISRKYRRRLARADRVTPTLRLTATDLASNRTRITREIVLKHANGKRGRSR